MRTFFAVWLSFVLGIATSHAPLWTMVFAAGVLCFFSVDVQEWIRRE